MIFSIDTQMNIFVAPCQMMRYGYVIYNLQLD